MNKYLKIFILSGIGFIINKAGSAQDINFQFRDTSGLVNSYINIPLKSITTFTGRGVVSYNLQFSFSPAYLSAEGVVTTGTISATLGTPVVNTSVPGLITIAGAGTTALSGPGTFIYLRFKVLATGISSITNTGTGNNFLNEGSPVLTLQNNCNVEGIPLPVIDVTPSETILLKGETLQFSATGGRSPYTWSTTNTGVSTISASGLLTATQVGTTTVKAVDADSYFGLSNNIEIRSYRVSVPDTTGIYNTYFKMPVRVTSLTGLNVLSGTISISYNQDALTEVQIETANSLMQANPAPTVNYSVPGTIQLSFANSTALSGAGVFFWIKCKLSNSSGSSYAINIQNVVLNENLLPIIQNGGISYSAPPGIVIEPNSGNVVYGDSLLLTVGGSNPLPPFVWSVSDDGIADISSTGVLKAKHSGWVKVSVIDANSATSTSDFFQLFDTYLKIADTIIASGSQVDLPVHITSLPAGQGIYSIQGKIFTSDMSLFSLSDIILSGTPTASFSISSTKGPDYIQFAIAGVNAVYGNSILFKIRGILSQDANTGATMTLRFQDLLINEGTPLPYLQNGNVTATRVYTFIGNGNWDIAENWQNNLVPPLTLQANEEIIIDPLSGGECILNIEQHLSFGSKLTVLSGKRFRILSDLNINN